MTSEEMANWKAGFIERVSALGPETMTPFINLYAEDCVFSDPFHSLTGRKAIGQAYLSMFRNLHMPCFTDLVIAEASPSPDTPHQSLKVDHLDLAVRWVFRFSIGPNKPRRAIPGTSWLRVDARHGLIRQHEDHWDASLLFESFAGLSWAVGYLRQRVASASHVTNMT